MSGRTSQDTVDSQGDYSVDGSDENQIIQPPRPPAPPQRRRVRCLFPMLVAVFLVLVGVIATPLVVFIANGTAGELPFLGRFFGSKNDTTFGNVSLTGVTQAAPVRGESVRPSDSPSAKEAPQSVVKLGGNGKDPRPPARTPSGIAKKAQGAPPRRRDNSKRERVYAPSVGITLRTTTAKMDLVEVQALTEQVIVVPKDGVMSKLRVAAVSGGEENPNGHVSGHRQMAVHAAGVESTTGRGRATAHSGDRQKPASAPVGLGSVSGKKGTGQQIRRRGTRRASVASVAATTMVRGGAATNRGGRQSSPSTPVGLTNFRGNNGPRGSSAVTLAFPTMSDPSPTAPLENSSALASSHSLKKRHSWVGHKKTHRRMRKKNPRKRGSVATSRKDSMHATNAPVSATARHFSATGRPSKDENEKTGPSDLKRNTSEALIHSSADSNTSASRKQSKLRLPKTSFEPYNASLSTPKESTTVTNEAQVTTENRTSSATSSTNNRPGSGTLIHEGQPKRAFTERAAGPNQTDVIIKAEEKPSTSNSKFVMPSKEPSEEIERGSTSTVRESVGTSPEPSVDTTVRGQTPQDMDEGSGSEAGRFIDFKSHYNDTLEDRDVEEGDERSPTKPDASVVDGLNATAGQMPAIPQAASALKGNVSSISHSDGTDLEVSATGRLFTTSSYKPVSRKQSWETDVSYINIVTREGRDSIGAMSPMVLPSANETSNPENPSTEAWTSSNITRPAKALTNEKPRTTDYTIPNATKSSTSSTVISDRPGLLEIELKFPVSRKGKKVSSLLKTSTRTFFASTNEPLKIVNVTILGMERVNETTVSPSVKTPSVPTSAWQRSIEPLLATTSAADTTKLQPPASKSGIEISTVQSQVTTDADDDFDDDDKDNEDSTLTRLVPTTALSSTEGLVSSINNSLVVAKLDTFTESESEEVTTLAATSSNRSGDAHKEGENITAGYHAVITTSRTGGSNDNAASTTSRIGGSNNNAVSTTSRTGGRNRSVEQFGTRDNAASTTNHIVGGNLHLDVSFITEDRSKSTTLPNTLVGSSGAVSIVDAKVTALSSVASPQLPHATSRPPKEEASSRNESEDKQSNATTNGRLTQVTAITTTASSPSTAITTISSSSSRGRARLGSLHNGSDEGSVWRTILPPKNTPTTTKAATTSDTGVVGVEYYDDSKNDSVSDRRADATDGHSDATLHKRRIGGEVEDSTSKAGKKSDVFQTEYYYDDAAPSSKPAQSTKDDTTVAEYENAPEQDVVDDLFF